MPRSTVLPKTIDGVKFIDLLNRRMGFWPETHGNHVKMEDLKTRKSVSVPRHEIKPETLRAIVRAIADIVEKTDDEVFEILFS